MVPGKAYDKHCYNVVESLNFEVNQEYTTLKGTFLHMDLE